MQTHNAQTFIATIMFSVAFLITSALSVHAQEIDFAPEWYVAPDEPVFYLAPLRAMAGASCPTDSVFVCNEDSVLVGSTHYDYDDAGRTIRTIVWTYDPKTGVRTSNSTKEEHGFDTSNREIFSATYEWDVVRYDWRGIAKTENVYNSANQMESKISYVYKHNKNFK